MRGQQEVVHETLPLVEAQFILGYSRSAGSTGDFRLWDSGDRDARGAAEARTRGGTYLGSYASSLDRTLGSARPNGRSLAKPYPNSGSQASSG
jgi:hypothetical protein